MQQTLELAVQLGKQSKSYAGIRQTPIPEDGTKDGHESKGQKGRKGKIRTATFATDHVLPVNPRDKKENTRSVDTWLIQAISPKDLKIGSWENQG